MYKFVCDPEALFQMALAENHRNALKLEAAAATGGAYNGGAYPPQPTNHHQTQQQPHHANQVGSLIQIMKLLFE